MRTEDGYFIRQCLDGDSAAYGFLVEKYKKPVYALAYSRTGDFHEAQDITQEAFIKAYKNLHTLKRWDNFMGWLYRITSNLCKNWYRLRSRRPDCESIENQESSMLDQASMNLYNENALYESLREALESLPDIYRQVLVLRYFGDMKIHEISSFLGTSPDTVERRLKKALSQLKEEILTMIGTAKEQRELPAAFVFKIVETVKHIRINPISVKPLPWGLAMAAGFIAAIFGVSQHLDWQSPSELLAGSVLSNQSKVFEVGEYPVDMVNISSIATFSNQDGNVDGAGSEIPSLQNALLMAPQAEDGKWTKKADIPTPRSSLCTGVVNGKIYAIGGWPILPTVEEYNPKTDKWTKKADMPRGRQNHTAGVVNGKIYVIGGWNKVEGVLPAVDEYDPITDTWTRKADIPTPRMELSASVVNGNIYAIGGWRDMENFAIVEEYNPVTDTWTRKADMPTIRESLSTSAVNGKVYAIGGWNNIQDLAVVEEYDPVKNSWKRKADMPTARNDLSTSVANGKIYAIGGKEGEDVQYFSVVEEYDPKTDKWTKQNDMLTARAWLSANEAGGKIYVIGGGNKDIDFPAVEEYNTGSVDESINLKGKLPTTWGEAKMVLSK